MTQLSIRVYVRIAEFDFFFSFVSPRQMSLKRHHVPEHVCGLCFIFIMSIVWRAILWLIVYLFYLLLTHNNYLKRRQIKLMRIIQLFLDILHSVAWGVYVSGSSRLVCSPEPASRWMDDMAERVWGTMPVSSIHPLFCQHSRTQFRQPLHFCATESKR